MSTPVRTPSRATFAGLIDDAAVFPPGSFTLAEAVTRRGGRRGAPYVDLIGPLLLPPNLIAEALDQPTPLTIGVVGRPDVPLRQVLDAAHTVIDARGHSLAGLEIGYTPHWRDALDLGVPIAVEVSTDLFTSPQDRATLDDLAHDGLDQVRAKLRTGSTPNTPVPSPDQVATFIDACSRRGLAFKLTGGMHRAVSHRAATPSGGEDQFGFLNVLLATNELLEGGGISDAKFLLGQRDYGAVATLIGALDETRTIAARNAFHSYGCCDVLDPIRDLSDLNLIEETL